MLLRNGQVGRRPTRCSLEVKVNEEARKIWKTEAGASLLGKMLSGEPLQAEDKLTLQRLKQADPPKLARSQPAEPPPTKE